MNVRQKRMFVAGNRRPGAFVPFGTYPPLQRIATRLSAVLTLQLWDAGGLQQPTSVLTG